MTSGRPIYIERDEERERRDEERERKRWRESEEK
jgi:hypothetical protein